MVEARKVISVQVVLPLWEWTLSQVLFFIILHSSTKHNHLVYFCLPELHESGNEANCPVFDHHSM